MGCLVSVRSDPFPEGATMLYPSDPDITPSAVRDGRQGPVTCVACGCRLTPASNAFVHFGGSGGRDARGCRIDCAEATHDPVGRPIALAV